jgi:signal transduction histidine kinase
VTGIQDVSDLLGGIAQASEEQSNGLEAVNRNVGDLDTITRENGSLVEQSTTASQVLMERAEALRAAVSTMRLRHGSADEALAMVNKAKAHFETVGRAQALKDIHSKTGEFVDRDLYLFGLDRQCHYFLHSAKPELVGSHLFAAIGREDTQFTTDAWERADAGGGWIHYEIADAQTGQFKPKESYVMALGPDELIGCGCYQVNGSH